jgi:hypothetical protein
VSIGTAAGTVSVTQLGSNNTATIDIGSGPGTIGGDVNVNQTGPNSTASVTESSVGGSIGVTQGAGTDNATVNVTTVGGSITVKQSEGSAGVATATVENSTSVGGNITVSQTSGNGDTATVKNISLVGNITVSQTSGNGDTATITNITEIIPAMNPPASVTYSISQGSGAGDLATISSVNAPNGNVSITQTDSGDPAVNMGLGDTAEVLNVTIGTAPGLVDTNGQVTISQGNAPGDVALVQGGSSNNILISQGDNAFVANGSTQAFDVAEVNNTTVTSNIIIIQGTANSAGSNVAAIGFDYLGFVNGDGASGSVTAGGITAIQQQGGNNQVYLGDAGSSFTTTFLDVYTGALGGAFVWVQNTTVNFGVFPPVLLTSIDPRLTAPFSDTYNIDGGGTGNSAVLSNSPTVTADPDNFTIFVM